MEEEHDPVNFTGQLRQALSADKLPIAFLLGAGCPCSIRVAKPGGGSDPLIPDIRGLTAKVSSLLSASDSAPRFASLRQTFAEDGMAEPTVEDMLNRVRAFREVAGSVGVRGLATADLDALDRAISDAIRREVKCDLPDTGTPYHALAEFIQIRRTPAVEIFTTNYDLLVEEALEDRKVPYFDGFVGSVKPFLDRRAIEEDEVSDRWARLWKIHGSINWRVTDDVGTISRMSMDSDGGELVIHPSHLKYDQSRRMPYLVMLDRLRGFLRQSRPVALVIAGYSFGDQHINAALVEGLQYNPSAACFALQFGLLENYQVASTLAEKNHNLGVFAEDSAVYRGRKGPWARNPAVDQGFLNGIFEIVEPSSPGASGKSVELVTGESKFLLGDFARFGDFVQQFVGLGRNVRKE